MYRHYFDSHVHTDNSADGKHKITFLCETAVKKQMNGFAVTDHFECDQTGNRMGLAMTNSVMDIRRAQIAFPTDLIVTCGIEIGQPLFNMDACKKILGLTQYDFVLAALHRDPEHPLYREMDFKTISFQEIDQCLTSYYNEMLRMVKWDGFDSLAHLTYPLSQIEGVHCMPVDMDYYEEVIRKILQTLVENGKALELNTAGLRTNYGRCMPTLKYLRWFKELGGEMITIGSDAYGADELGADIGTGMEMLEQLGYQYFTIYRSRKPVMIRLL